MRLIAALSGDLNELVQRELSAAEKAVSAAVGLATNGLKNDLRAQVISAGLGARLAGTWRGATYPRGGASVNAAGMVYSKAPQIIRSFEHGAVIRSSRGAFLAIPTPAAGTGPRGKRLTPEEWERRRGIKLRLVYRRGMPSLLVADDARLTSRGRAAANVGRSKGAEFVRLTGRTTVPVFILVPQVTLRKRLDVVTVGEKWAGELPKLIEQRWQEQ